MRWQDLLDHMITVEGECLEENYGKGRALNDADERRNAKVRKAYAELLAVRSVLMAAPDLLDSLKWLLADWEEAIAYEKDYMGIANHARKAVAKAEGRTA